MRESEIEEGIIKGGVEECIEENKFLKKDIFGSLFFYIYSFSE